MGINHRWYMLGIYILVLVLSGKGANGRTVTSCTVTTGSSSITINASFSGNHQMLYVYLYSTLRSLESFLSPCMNAISASYLSVYNCYDGGWYMLIYYNSHTVSNSVITLRNFNFPATAQTFTNNIALQAYWSGWGSSFYCSPFSSVALIG